MINDKISKEKIEKYYNLTSKALEIAKKSIEKEKESKENFAKIAKFSGEPFENSLNNIKKVNYSKFSKEIILMVECYLSDSKHFEKKQDYVNAFACLNYAHGWLDSGARLKIFNVSNNKLFTV